MFICQWIIDTFHTDGHRYNRPPLILPIVSCQARSAVVSDPYRAYTWRISSKKEKKNLNSLLHLRGNGHRSTPIIGNSKYYS